MTQYDIGHSPAASLSGKVAIVTGASRGIGAGLARRLAADGATVVGTFVSDASREKAEALRDEVQRAGGSMILFQGDLADASTPERLIDFTVAELGRIDILVNNAAVGLYKTVGEFSIEEVQHTLALNVQAPFLLSQAAAAHMGPGSRIINIASTVAHRMARTTGSLYATSKSAIIGLTKGMARDLGPRGITVNLVSPGPVRTELLGDDPEKIELMISFLALDRIGEPEDIAGIVAFLASPQSDYITGAQISADGGYTI